MEEAKSIMDIPEIIFEKFKDGQEVEVPIGIAANLKGGSGAMVLIRDEANKSVSLKIFHDIPRGAIDGFEPVVTIITALPDNPLWKKIKTRDGKNGLLIRASIPRLWLAYDLRFVVDAIVARAIELARPFLA